MHILVSSAGQAGKMADLLGSILGSMEKPPTMGDEERKKRKGVYQTKFYTLYDIFKYTFTGLVFS